MKRISKKGTSKPIPIGVLIGLAASTAITLSISALVANLVIKEKMETESIGYAAIGILVLASAAGTVIAEKAVKTKRLLVAGCMNGSYFATLLAVNALFFGGQYEGVATTAVSIIVGGLAGFAMTGATKRSIKKKGKIGAYR